MRIDVMSIIKTFGVVSESIRNEFDASGGVGNKHDIEKVRICIEEAQNLDSCVVNPCT
jgi:hypothetical protein